MVMESDASETCGTFSFDARDGDEEVRPSKVTAAMPSEEVDPNGDIDKLREQFKDYLVVVRVCCCY